MSWLSELSIVYDKVYRNRDCADSDRLLPLYHTSNNASVTIVLNEEAECEKIILLRDKDKSGEEKIKSEPTLMPCTESCSSRSSGADAYPLCDKMEYVCGGLSDKDDEKHSKYLALLSSWANSVFSVKKVKIVYDYLKKETLLKDLFNNNIKKEEVSDFVRFSVEMRGSQTSELWKDPAVIQSWIDYYNSEEFDNYCKKNYSGKKELSKRLKISGLDYVSGNEEKIAVYHPSKIRNSGDAAKLISSNDTVNFTYLGRFLSADEAVQISSNTTQKAHSALRWLIQRQGKPIGEGMSVVLWNRAGDKLPTLTESSSDEVFEEDYEDDEDYEDETVYATGDAFALSFISKMKGFFIKGKTSSSNIMIMIIKEANSGKGRASVALYRELQESEIEKAIDNWYGRLYWYHTYWKKKEGKKSENKLMRRTGTPSLMEIVKCAYGDEVKKSIMEMTVQRLYLCILERKPIPRDLEKLCFSRASNPIAIDSDTVREMNMEIACAVYKYNHSKEDYKLSLEKDRKTRDYLFGRLLAFAHQYEKAYLRRANTDRDTNAIRYMKQFSIHPTKTWKMLEVDKISVFRKAIDQPLASWFDQRLEEIFDLFDVNDFNSDKPLEAEFLLGYHCQLKEFRKNKDNKEEVLEEEN